MPQEIPKLTGIKHVQIKLTLDEYDELDDLAHAARQKITNYARELFVKAIHAELQKPATANKSGNTRPFRDARSR